MNLKDTYQEIIDTWESSALLYEKSFMNLKLYNDSYDKFSELIGNSPTRVLEIGCGPGNITKFLIKHNNKMSIIATDVSMNMVQLAQKNNPTADCRPMDARDLSSLNQTFDGIVAGFILPYLLQKDGELFLKNCVDALEKNGVLYLSFVAGKNSNSTYIKGSTGNQMFFSYYPLDQVIGTLQKYGMEILETQKVPYIYMERIKEVHTILIAKKN
jgi:cyclopropane fatty-acyl-phospholipid synthase-like methyltransferase